MIATTADNTVRSKPSDTTTASSSPSTSWRVLGALTLVLVCSACSSRLELTARGQGLPFPTTELMVEIFERTRHETKGADCVPTMGYRYVALPSGDPIFVNIKPGPFAKSNMSIEYGDLGAVTKISFGSEPAADAIAAGAEGLSSLLPFVGLLPSVRASTDDTDDSDKERAGAPETRTRPACNTGEQIRRLVPANDFRASTEPSSFGGAGR